MGTPNETISLGEVESNPSTRSDLAQKEKTRYSRVFSFCVLRILWINDVTNVFEKEECVQGTHQGFLARSIPARRRKVCAADLDPCQKEKTRRSVSFLFGRG